MASGFSSASLIWSHDFKGRFMSSLRCRLLLNSVHEDDSGTYTCKLSTAKGELPALGAQIPTCSCPL